MRRLAFLCAALALTGTVGCGDDTRDGGPITGRPAEALSPIFREWGAEERFGYVFLDVQTKDPTSLDEPTCTLDAQLAVATELGFLPFTDSEGFCIVTDTETLVGMGPDPAPTCAGFFDVAYGEGQDRLTVCRDIFPSPIGVDCAEAQATGGMRVLSAADEVPGDVLETLDISVPLAPLPIIREPESQGDGVTVWPEDLIVAWDTTGADGIEIVLSRTDRTGPQVRCIVGDTGRFEIPARLTTAYRSGVAALEVATIEQVRETVDDFNFRVSTRRSDAIWIFNR